MKYIRKYSEDILGDDLKDPEWRVKNKELLNDVKEDIDNYLSYLFDNSDFKYDARIAGSDDSLSLQITIGKLGQYISQFKFNDIKDELIPFCQIISKKYDVIKFYTRYTMSVTNQRGVKVDYGTEIFKIEDIVADRVGDGNIVNFCIDIKANSKPPFVYPKKKTILDKFKSMFK